MARVTIVTPYFWPEQAANVPLVIDLLTDLVKSGHSVSVVTSHPSRNIDEKASKDYRRDPRKPEYFRGARVIRFPNATPDKTGLIAKLQETVGFWFWAAVGSMQCARGTDLFIVYSTPPFLSIPVSWSRIMKAVPIVYNLQDLFPDSAVKSGLLHNHALVRILRRVERTAYEKALVVTAISPSIGGHVQRVTSKPQVRVLPNWTDTESVRFIPRNQNRFLPMLPADFRSKFIVLYAGNIGFAQNVDVIVDAAQELQGVANIRFVIAGDGQGKAAIQSKLEGLNLPNIALLPLQPQDMVADVYSACDVGLVTVRKGIGECAVPSKTWPMMACSRPVIACIDTSSDLAKLIDSHDIGMVVPPEDPKALAEAIMVMYSDSKRCREIGIRARTYVEHNLSRVAITSAYSKLVDEIADNLMRRFH